MASIFRVENPRARNQREQVDARRHIPEDGILHSHRLKTSNLTKVIRFATSYSVESKLRSENCSSAIGDLK
jgi:hypothetical protein